MTTTNTQPDYAKLFNEALTQSYKELRNAYLAFYRYSALNRQLAASQMLQRGLPISPLGTFKHWKEKGMNVMKGQKAIMMYMPLTKKVEVERDGDVTEETKTFFSMRPNWFAMSQTDGWRDGVADLETPEDCDWNSHRALAKLGVSIEAFNLMEANCEGYSFVNTPTVAISPLAEHPIGVLVHELAHQLLHNEGDGKEFSHAAKEVEAESVAYIVCASLGLLDEVAVNNSRKYIQSYAAEMVGFDVEDIKAKHSRRIFGTVEKILKAGQPVKKESAE
jgi:antirestriction protein ArdC